MTVPLGHLINVLHSLKSSVGSSSVSCQPRKHKEHLSNTQLPRREVRSSVARVYSVGVESTMEFFFKLTWLKITFLTTTTMLKVVKKNILLRFVQPICHLQELGLSEVGPQKLDEIVNSMLPNLGLQNLPSLPGDQTPWRTSHKSTHSFFHNKNGKNVYTCY